MVKQTMVSGALGLLVMIGVPAATAQEPVVVPNALANVDGSSSNIFPLCGFTTLLPYRYQQVYLGSEVGSGLISEIAFRQDHSRSDTFAPAVFAGMIISLSTTAAQPDGLSAAMDDNLGPDVQQVAAGTLVLSTSASPADPRPFDVVIPVDPPFPFDAATGNLLLEVIASQEPPWATFFDTAAEPLDSVSRALCDSDSSCLSGAPANEILTAGAVTRFSFASLFTDGFESGDTSAWSTHNP